MQTELHRDVALSLRWELISCSNGIATRYHQKSWTVIKVDVPRTTKNDPRAQTLMLLSSLDIKRCVKVKRP